MVHKEDHKSSRSLRGRDLRVRPLAVIVTAALTLVALTACGLSYSRWNLERAERYQQEWGTLNASDLLLLPNRGQFAAALTNTGSDYANRIRAGGVQGALRRSIQEAFDTSASIGIAASGERMAGPPDARSSVPREDRSALGTLNPQQFSTVLPLSAAPLTLSESQITLMALNGMISEQVLEYLSNPTSVPGNKRVFMGVLQVSCDPGWRTGYDYTGEVEIVPEYARIEGGREVYSSQVDRTYPTVLSAFPFTETQVLDMASSTREQISWALYLSAVFQASGVPMAGESLTDYARRLEADASTRTAVPVISSYTSGTRFGYRFSPVFQAIQDPSLLERLWEGSSGHVLHPTSIPAVVIVICDAEEIAPQGSWTHIALNYSTRWIPRERGPFAIARRGQSMRDRRRLAWHIDQARPSHAPSIDEDWVKIDTVRRLIRDLTAALESTRATPWRSDQTVAALETAFRSALAAATNASLESVAEEVETSIVEVVMQRDACTVPSALAPRLTLLISIARENVRRAEREVLTPVPEDMPSADRTAPVARHSTGQSTLERISELDYRLLDEALPHTILTPLPVDAPPQPFAVTAVYPASAEFGETTRFGILGRGFLDRAVQPPRPIVPVVTICGFTASQVVVRSDTLLEATLALPSIPVTQRQTLPPGAVTVATTAVNATLAGSVTLVIPKTGTSDIAIGRNAQGRVTSIDVSPDTTPDQIMETIRQLFRSEPASSDVHVNVQVGNPPR